VNKGTTTPFIKDITKEATIAIAATTRTVDKTVFSMIDKY
jgi:hypothetical protein